MLYKNFVDQSAVKDIETGTLAFLVQMTTLMVNGSTYVQEIPRFLEWCAGQV